MQIQLIYDKNITIVKSQSNIKQSTSKAFITTVYVQKSGVYFRHKNIDVVSADFRIYL